MRAPSAAALDAAEPDELAPADAEAPIAGAGSAGIRGGGLVTTPAALSEVVFAFLSDASSIWMQELANTPPSITTARIRNRSADAIMAARMASPVPYRGNGCPGGLPAVPAPSWISAASCAGSAPS